MTKSFALLLVMALALGASIGGAFAGGVAFGKSQQGDSTFDLSGMPAGSLREQALSGRLGQGMQVQPGQGLQGASPSLPIPPLDRGGEGGLAQPRESFQSPFGSGEGGAGLASRGGLTGTVEAVEGNTVTVNTPLGQLQVIVDEETAVRRFAEGAIEDLVPGVQVTVTGERGEDGIVQALSILLTPEGAGDRSPEGFPTRDRFQPGQGAR